MELKSRFLRMFAVAFLYAVIAACESRSTPSKISVRKEGPDQAPDFALLIEGIRQTEIFIPTRDLRDSSITKAVIKENADTPGCQPLPHRTDVPLFSRPYDGAIYPLWDQVGKATSKTGFRVTKGWYQTTITFTPDSPNSKHINMWRSVSPPYFLPRDLDLVITN